MSPKCEKLDSALRPYSKIVLILDSVLKWDAPFYPPIIGGVVTLFFSIMWLTDMSTLSYICVLGIFATIADFGLPIVNDILAKDWSPKDEEKFNRVCEKVSSSCQEFGSFFGRFSALRKENIKMYYIILLSVLLSFAWIGTWLSDIFLLYLVALFVAMYPGLSRQEAFQSFVGDKLAKISSFLPQSSSSSSSSDSSSSKKNKKDK